MLTEEIQLNVDAKADGTTIPVAFTRFDGSIPNRSIYIQRDEHTLAHHRKLTFYRALPKKAGTSKGTAKCRFKFSSEHSIAGVDGTAVLTLPAIVEVAFSLPVGLSPEDTLFMVQQAVALMSSRSVIDPLTLRQEI